jgi:hypothetical protein
MALQHDNGKLSQVVAETDGQVFRDEAFIAHLERLEAADDDLPADQQG